MPRSGTTLVEQILAAHPDVHGAGELKVLSHLAASAAHSDWARGESYPNYLDLVSSPDRLNGLADAYLSAVASINGTARYVLDKKPQNFLYLGLIELLFGSCHVIHCVRDPIDTCVSCYMTFFGASGDASASGQSAGKAAWNWGPAGSLSGLGAFYRAYERQMRHWKEVLTVRTLDVRYEDVVNDLEGQVGRLLEFLGLPWNDRCLRFHESKRPVNTPSAAQVRKPVYRSSVGRWKQYGPQLSELIAALGGQPDRPTP
jgi:hypothetical protein